MSEDNSNMITYRKTNSLVALTRRFVSLLKCNKTGISDLKFAANVLDVPKRRIYDILNVLEGIGLVRKHKCSILWSGKVDHIVRNDYSEFLNYLRETLGTKEKEIDADIAMARKNLRLIGDDPINKSFSYVTRDDLLNVYGDKTLMTIKNYKQALKRGDNNILCLNGHGEGTTIDVRLVTNEGDSFIKDQEVINNLLQRDQVEDELKNEFNKQPRTSKRSRIAKASTGMFIFPKLQKKDVVDDRKKLAKILLRDWRTGHSIVSRYSNQNYLAEFPFLQINPPREIYNFSLSSNEGVCELFDIENV